MLNIQVAVTMRIGISYSGNQEDELKLWSAPTGRVHFDDVLETIWAKSLLDPFERTMAATHHMLAIPEMEWMLGLIWKMNGFDNRLKKQLEGTPNRRPREAPSLSAILRADEESCD